MMTRTVSVAIAAVAAACVLARAVPSAQQPAIDGRIVTTESQVVAEGRPLRYTARAGHLPIRDEASGDVHAWMFFIAYTAPRPAGAPPRPLTFLWNGGPGSSSSLVHLLGFGPKRIGARGAMVDNAGTWLDFTDLVFVDPIGTGYSRPVKAEYGQEFYQTKGDAESVATFISGYRERFEAADAPVFLAGESYGVTRAAGVADVLTRRGITVSGTVLIGLTLPLGELSADEQVAYNVPSYTAAAFANRALAPDLLRDLPSALRQSEAWASTRYLEALASGASLADAARDEAVNGLARFTGFDPARIDRTSLTIPMPLFSEQLLAVRKLMVGRYDTRTTAPFDAEQVRMYDPTKDPSLKNIIDNVAVTRYFRSVLHYENDLAYQGPFGGGYPPPTSFRGDWMSVRWNRSAPGATFAAGPGETGQPLARAMTANPSLKVLSACGHFDLVCSYFGNEQLAARLDPELKSRVTVRSYGGGHAIYTDDRVRLEMKRDAAAFMRDARQAPSDRDATVTTTHSVTVGGRTLNYTARAGMLPIRVNDTGETHGQMFFVAYTLDNRGVGPRPLTFLWNGGPGSDSSLLHLTGFGPQRLTDCQCAFDDNEQTWLAQSDLVFVDPIGTGFSRPSRDEYGAEFYNTLGDIASVAEFVRVYLTRFDAWDRPIFLAGESYGAWRASGVAEALEQRGQRVAGVVLISGGVQVGQVMDDELRTALFIPTRTAAAFQHKRLEPALQGDLQATLREAEAWAEKDYAPALRRVASLTSTERDAIVSQLARFTGLDQNLIDRDTLVVGRQQFAEGLLRDEKKTLARFDTRETAGPDPLAATRAATVNRYLREALKFETDLDYAGVASVGAKWDYNQAPPPPAGTRPPSTDGPPGGPQPWLRRAMDIDPALKVFVATGLYDSLNSCAVHARVGPALGPDLAGNVTAVCYDGGHMMYEDAATRAKMTADVAAFIRAAAARR